MNNVAVYWQMAKQGQRLMLANGELRERIGGVRETPRGFDALALTFGYDPEHARRDIASMDEAKAFVESFKPWELYVSDPGISVALEVRPLGEYVSGKQRCAVEQLYQLAHDAKLLELERADEGRVRLVLTLNKLGQLVKLDFILHEDEASALATALSK